MISKVRIESINDTPYTKIYVNDKQIEGVRSYNISQSVNEFPRVEVELCSWIAYDHNADVEFYIHPESIRECIAGIAWEMRKDEEFRQSIIESIRSAIEEVRSRNQTDVINDYELSSRIAERLFLGDK